MTNFWYHRALLKKCKMETGQIMVRDYSILAYPRMIRVYIYFYVRVIYP
jgi:hypothetical protein